MVFFGDFGLRGFFLVEEDKVVPRRDGRAKELGNLPRPIQAGLSSYVSPDMLASVPNPGAMAAAAWYRAAALVIEKKMRDSKS
ncbi:uncharacterized protein A4U43_C05F9000 [Asparagus officinalis]|uniref:Uncharacterized protein n=1 Tax=Asparagus officinalis TaxID=4686 RepID=A0A5P1EQC8_ASPOF|nr:uncharacterized protein A4U43_C05F9000 [Asparagus officinalis]